ncbi:helix-turn-helix transcriptional regulator [Actinoplanes sp. TFC3]|uniref:helix-turn-helix transcriptional regulator n=1 Tax=Actinoplanes sp. TFC3 TaxID=1710355 RepID=UPI00082D0EBA|nr:helix-turn-helix transcriptional regulator [Actinoplanes sp. TFC3]
MKTELAAFLRSRRERLTPADAGLPMTGRRRTPGLRREEVAMLAGVSATWYTYLEQGRDVRPSEQVLNAIAGTLQLSGPERDHLQQLAGTTTPPPMQETADPGVAALPSLLGENPAYVTGATFDLLACNDAVTELLAGLHTGANLARWMFTHPGAKQVLVDWEPVAQSLLARLRATAVRDKGVFSRLIEDLHAASPEVRQWWPRYDIATARSGTKRLRHPRRGVITFQYTSLLVADHPDETVVIYTPAA